MVIPNEIVCVPTPRTLYTVEYVLVEANAKDTGNGQKVIPRSKLRYGQTENGGHDYESQCEQFGSRGH